MSDKNDAKERHRCICPVCMSWLSEHPDPVLKREGWVRCASCRYSEKRTILDIKNNKDDLKKDS